MFSAPSRAIGFVLGLWLAFETLVPLVSGRG